MYFKSLCAFVALILPAAVVASPVADVSNGLVDLHARAFVLNVRPTPGGDYDKILHPRPISVPRPDKDTCPNFKQVNANWKKISNACANYDNMEIQFNNRVIPSVTRVLQAAEGALNLAGLNILALVKSSFHTSDPKTDPMEHWTFTFEAPACGNAGEVCTGHAYDPNNAPIGRIWSAKHVELYHGCK